MEAYLWPAVSITYIEHSLNHTAFGLPQNQMRSWQQQTVVIYIYIYIYIYTLPHGGWALWRRNFRLPLASCKALRKNWALWQPLGYKNVNKRTLLLLLLDKYHWKIPLANVVRLLVERSETESNEKLGGFRTWLRASYWRVLIERNSLSIDYYIYIY